MPSAAPSPLAHTPNRLAGALRDHGPPQVLPAGAACGAVVFPASAALAHSSQLPSPPDFSCRVTLFFLVTQWLNNFKRLALCTQLQLFKSSAGSKLLHPGTFSIQWEISINISNLQPGTFHGRRLLSILLEPNHCSHLLPALNGTMRNGGRRVGAREEDCLPSTQASTWVCSIDGIFAITTATNYN